MVVSENLFEEKILVPENQNLNINNVSSNTIANNFNTTTSEQTVPTKEQALSTSVYLIKLEPGSQRLEQKISKW